ncbi:ArsR/SmtB family transcription factor [Actinoallomurus soli]|uniref:ArsR/SmtB family transcription factor n=1 Tax=Actinoallomurus soli TaxID=2952535 RepID=UPI0020927945|nr:helix-turn-helix transcriptional regulator [Actinoallomurus soli]MCO5972117.1 ArsR family transcriptional regulator [Actinoallomurus soli]
MAGWLDPEDPVLASVTSLARELADPIRLTVLQVLAAEGSHTMSQLADALGVSAPRLGNHLARLRTAGLVTVEHSGRHATYRVAEAGIGEVLAALSRFAGGGAADTRPHPRAEVHGLARTCYDHAAGRLGVAVFATLVERGALVPPDGRTAELALGPERSVFAEFGVDPDAVRPGRRKLATACLDRIQRLPHLGGALGREILDTFVERGLVEPRPGTRDLQVTERGLHELPALLPGFAAAAE